MEDNLKGITQLSGIFEYETKGALIPGNRYMLYLSCQESVYYPDAIYTSIDKESITIINENNFANNEKFSDKKMNQSELVNQIKNSKFISSKKEKNDDFKDKAEDYKELSDMSDYVIQVIHKKFYVQISM